MGMVVRWECADRNGDEDGSVDRSCDEDGSVDRSCDEDWIVLIEMVLY